MGLHYHSRVSLHSVTPITPLESNSSSPSSLSPVSPVFWLTGFGVSSLGPGCGTGRARVNCRSSPYQPARRPVRHHLLILYCLPIHTCAFLRARGGEAHQRLFRYILSFLCGSLPTNLNPAFSASPPNLQVTRSGRKNSSLLLSF